MNVIVNVSNKKEAERANVEYETKKELRTGLQEHNHAVDKTLNETSDNIRRTLDEAKRDIPRNTQVVSDYQEHNLQATREITDSYLESQKDVIHSYQSALAPIIENTYDAFWNNWASPRRAAELYARTASLFADSLVTATRIANNTLVANIDAYKTFVEHETDDAKEFSRLATDNARTFENTSREFAHT